MSTPACPPRAIHVGLTVVQLLPSSPISRPFQDPLARLKRAKLGSRRLFDHLVGARKERRRYGEAKRLCGLEINRKLEPSWLNDRQFGRLLTF
jgi:hypothetical protein